MTIKALYPTVRPTLNLDFAKTKALDPRVTFTRASTGTFVGSNGLIQTAASGAPRFDHNPATGESLGLLVEEARTNNFLYSEQFDNAYWYQNAVSVTANSAVAPDGTLTADKIIPNTSNVPHEIIKAVGVTGSYSTTIYAKNGGYNGVVLSAYTGAFYEQIRVNLSTGTINTISSGATGSLTAFANGWYKVTLSTTLPASSGIYITVTNNNAGSFAGDGTSGIHIWGAQLEAGAFPTSYIPTSGSTVTRAADVASMTGTNFSSWYNNAQGSFYAQYKHSSSVRNSPTYILGTSGYEGNGFIISFGTSVTTLPIKAAVGFTDLKTLSPSQTAYSNPSISTVVGGKFEGYPDSLEIGTKITSPSGSKTLNGTMARLSYYPVRLPDAQLQALTAT